MHRPLISIMFIIDQYGDLVGTIYTSVGRTILILDAYQLVFNYPVVFVPVTQVTICTLNAKRGFECLRPVFFAL